MSNGFKSVMGIIIFFILFVVGSAFYSINSKKNQEVAHSNEYPETTRESPVIEEKTDEERGFERILSNATLTDAIEMVKPSMTDEFNAFPASAGVLAIWMENKETKVSDIKNLDSTTRGKILKDSYNERGKKLCVTGEIVEIEVDRSGGFPVYHAGLAANYSDFTRILAVGSTGDLIANSNATFCGVVIGKVGFNNAVGGTTNAPYLVGMFDLPENR